MRYVWTYVFTLLLMVTAQYNIVFTHWNHRFERSIRNIYNWVVLVSAITHLFPYMVELNQLLSHRSLPSEKNFCAFKYLNIVCDLSSIILFMLFDLFVFYQSDMSSNVDLSYTLITNPELSNENMLYESIQSSHKMWC